MQEPTQDVMQELTQLANKRRAAITAQRAIEAEMRPLLAAARRQGISLRKISAVTDLSVNTVNLWAAAAGGAA